MNSTGHDAFCLLFDSVGLGSKQGSFYLLHFISTLYRDYFIVHIQMCLGLPLTSKLLSKSEIRSSLQNLCSVSQSVGCNPFGWLQQIFTLWFIKGTIAVNKIQHKELNHWKGWSIGKVENHCEILSVLKYSCFSSLLHIFSQVRLYLSRYYSCIFLVISIHVSLNNQ